MGEITWEPLLLLSLPVVLFILTRVFLAVRNWSLQSQIEEQQKRLGELKLIDLNRGRDWGNYAARLDRAAEAQLSASDLGRYHEYKRELWGSGSSWQNAEDALGGFIWDCLDEPYNPNEDDDHVGV